ncbi:hypothetical protein [Colwellia piezophila]|uniref:hypothetical protein n=1 Tax=Colwellia piezophila TaxID=211668 RepID=UPI00035D01DB|nr:hypothetical protein [Colwellia piezophila]
MQSANIPHLYIRNGIYYYRNNSYWKSLRTRCKKEAFKQLAHLLFGTVSEVVDKSPTKVSCDAEASKPQSSAAVASSPKFGVLIKAYLDEHGHRWSLREYTRIENPLKFLPKKISIKKQLLRLSNHC